MSLFQDAHRELCKRIALRNTTVAISLTANSQEYDLDPNIYQVHEAYYETSANASDWRILYEKSLDQLVIEMKGWRLAGTSQEPFYYYITSAVSADSAKPQIGFYPIPNRGTSGTYPRVRLYVTQYADLSGSETVPTNLLDDKVYTYQIARDWASSEDPEKFAYWSQLADIEIQRNVLHIRNLQTYNEDFVIGTPFRASSKVT